MEEDVVPENASDADRGSGWGCIAKRSVGDERVALCHPVEELVIVQWVLGEETVHYVAEDEKVPDGRRCVGADVSRCLFEALPNRTGLCGRLTVSVQPIPEVEQSSSRTIDSF